MRKQTMHISFFKMITVYVIATCFLGGCEKDIPVLSADATGPNYTIAIGGDLILGRKLNASCYQPAALGKLFGDIKPILKRADLAILNAEGVISGGGGFANKKELDSYMFRAHPNILDALIQAGIDALAVGNNHSGDYGPAALLEMLDRLTDKGIGYFGAGENKQDALRPAYLTAGDLKIAVVGGDLTRTRTFQAGPSTPGTLYFGRIAAGKNHLAALKTYTKILREAKQKAHVVIFSPHWGDNWKTAPTKHTVAFAHQLIDAGYDAIVGHSAHLAQGIEVYKGKPILYDVGNVLLDHKMDNPKQPSFLFELSVNKAGVTGVTGHALSLRTNRTTLAKGEIKKNALALLKEKSDELGAKINIDSGVAKLACRPGLMNVPTVPLEKRPVRPIREAPSDTLLDALPKGVTPLNVRYKNGITLLGYKMAVKYARPPHGAQVIQLFFKTGKKLTKNYNVHLEARGLAKKTNNPTTVYGGHIPGDWLLPSDQWPVDKIIQDWTLFRTRKLGDKKPITFYAGLWDGKEIIEDKLIPLGELTFKPGAKMVLDVLDEQRAKSVMHLSQYPKN